VRLQKICTEVFLSEVISTPGHTPSCISYYIHDDAVFVGDTLFMPDSGTARCDFPNGSAHTLWESLQQLLILPDHVRLFVGHDYAPNGREIMYETTIGEERKTNKHVGAGITKEDFLKMRITRDNGLPVPRLLFPSIQMNMIGGKMPQPEANGFSYLKLPLKYKDEMN
jgi:glyoxylase-like metal-dependent hydrolase (beta-lactamase superfamily II)